jgi:hypothetical protein
MIANIPIIEKQAPVVTLAAVRYNLLVPVREPNERNLAEPDGRSRWTILNGVLWEIPHPDDTPSAWQAAIQANAEQGWIELDRFIQMFEEWWGGKTYADKENGNESS